MPRFAPSTPPRVRVSDCLCPGTPHEAGDYVVLEPELTVDGGLAASAAVARAVATGGDFTAEVLSAALPYQIRSWDFLDADTKQPLEITPASVEEALPWTKGGKEVAQTAFDLYVDQILGRAPLASRGSDPTTDSSSSSTPTAETSAKARSSSRRRKP